jgi:hypothetical protein
METKTLHPAFVSVAGIPSVNTVRRLLASQTKARALKHTFAICTVMLIGSQCGFAQGFVNLDFESANIPPGTPINSMIPATNAFPGWSATAPVGYDFLSIGGAIISIVDANVGSEFAPLQGQYSAMLFGGEGGPTTLSQTGTVPIGTKSLQVDLNGSGVTLFSGVSFLIVTMGGQTIQLVPEATFPNYTQYGGDISSFAGQMTSLGFTEQPPAGVPPSFLELDDIQFSVSPVPEPGTLALFATGAVLLALRRKPRSPNCAALRS